MRKTSILILNMYKYFLAYLFVLLGTLHTVNAQVPVDLTGGKLSYDLSSHTYVYIDPSGQEELDDVIKTQNIFNFEKDTKQLNHGFSDASFWFKFKLRNEDLSKKWLFEISYPVLDSVEFYFLNEDGDWQVRSMGDMQPFYNRELDHRNFLIPLDFPDNSVQLYYVHVKTSSAVRVPMRIIDEWQSYKESLENEIMYGIYFGIMLVMILYNLFIFFTLNDVNYLYYVLSIISALLFFSSVSGHGFQYLWFDYIWLANFMVPISMGAWAIFAALFARSFLEAKKFAPTLNKLLIFIMISGGGIILASIFIGYGISVMVGAGLLALCSLLIIITGFGVWRNGNKSARYFTLAWVFFMTGNIFYVFLSYGFLPDIPLFEHSSKVGAILEVIMLSLALSDKYSILREEKVELQQAALLNQQENNLILERKVLERTKEISEKSDKIELQNKRLGRQNHEISKQKEKIESSIRYAKRIQSVMLPSRNKFTELLPESFVFYRPRDIVSGDFYWISEVEDKIILAAVDCTGHGVPGAFMSILGTNLLNEITNVRGITSPEQILAELHNGVKSNLHQEDNNNKDGMEAGICVIDIENRELEFAGAGTPLIYFENNELQLIKGSRLPIGGVSKANTPHRFQKHVISFYDPIELYMFSDGFRDQFGGSNSQKFGMKRFKYLLKDIHHAPIGNQHTTVVKTFDDWRGVQRQIDDVLLIGFRLE